MSLLPFAPSVTRLRRTAKACAAGELSRFEYRQARRQVIEDFINRNEPDENTLSRYTVDVTQRRLASPTEQTASLVSRGWLWWIVCCVMLLIALALPNWVAAATFSIPPLKDRDPNPATAQRYPVSTVYWQAPEYFSAADAAAVQEFLDAKLREVVMANAPSAHGFSAAELAEVGRFLDAIGIHDEDTVTTVADLEDLTALVANQKARRGVSTVELQAVADALQQWVRGQGYLVATAYVPAQTVTAGQVRLGVEIGRLASVVVQGGSGAAQQAMNLRLGALLGKPLERAALETQLNTFNRTPGYQASATLAPGLLAGDSELRMTLTEHRQWLGHVQIDNYGVDELGAERLSAGVSANNVSGRGDQLRLSGFTSVSSGDHQYGALSYRTPVLNGRYDLATSLGVGDVEYDAQSGLAGTSRLFDAALRDTRIFTREQRLELSAGVGSHSVRWDGLFDQRADFVRFGVDGHRLWDALKIALEGRVEATVGQVDMTFAGQSEQWWRVRAETRAWRPMAWVSRFGLPAATQAVVRVRAQAAADLLPSSMRLSIADAGINRGFAFGSAIVDSGVGISGEVRVPAPLGHWRLFTDVAYGERLGTPESWVQLTSLGAGWEAILASDSRGELSSRLTLAYPVSHKSSGVLNEDGSQIYWSLRYAR